MNVVKKIEEIVFSYSSFMDSSSIYNVIDNSGDSDPVEYFEMITKEWYESVDNTLGCKPEEFIESLPLPQSEDEVTEIIKAIAALYVDTPDFLISYLKKSEYTVLSLKTILDNDIILTDMNDNISEDVEIYQQAVIISSIYPDLIPNLFDAYKKSNDANELLFENISDSLLKLEAFKESAEFLNKEEDFSGKHLSLISMLGQYADKSEEVYYCLKNCFKRATDDIMKVIIAFAIGDYGDQRAIPFLRRHALQLYNNYKGTNDKETKNYFYHTISVIKELGGNVDDMQNI